MNIALILFGFVTEGFFTSFLSFLCALPSLPIEIKCIQKHELDGKLGPSCSHSLSVYENLRRKLRIQNTKLGNSAEGTQERVF